MNKNNIQLDPSKLLGFNNKAANQKGKIGGKVMSPKVGLKPSAKIGVKVGQKVV